MDVALLGKRDVGSRVVPEAGSAGPGVSLRGLYPDYLLFVVVFFTS